MSNTASNIVLALFGYNRAGKILWTVIAVAGLGVFLVKTGLLAGARFTEADERLFRAARHGDRGAIVQALASGANVDDESPLDGKTALFRAAVFGHADAVKALLDHGANPAAHGYDGQSAIDVVTAARAEEKDQAAAQALDEVAGLLRQSETRR